MVEQWELVQEIRQCCAIHTVTEMVEQWELVYPIMQACPYKYL